MILPFVVYLAIASVLRNGATFAQKEKVMIMNLGRWEPSSNVIGGERCYIATRLKNVKQPFHGENAEFFGDYSADEKSIALLCDRLNGLEPYFNLIDGH